MVKMELMEMLALLGPLEIEENLVKMVYLEILDLWVKKVHLVVLDLQECLVIRDHLVNKEIL